MQEVLRRMEIRLGLENKSLDYGEKLQPCANLNYAYWSHKQFILTAALSVLDLAEEIYESCRFEYLVLNGSAPWCAAFTEEDLLVFEYSQDLSYYWRKSYPHNITYGQACPLLADVVLKFTLVL